MGKSIGIDLGTTNSVMCVMSTEPEILLNSENGRLTPSIVALRRSKKTGDSIIIGKNAEDYAAMAGKDYLYSVKRLMGKGFDDEEVQRVAKRVSYEILPSPEGPEDVCRVKLGGELYRPQDVAALILKKMKKDAEMRLGESVDSAVITVPAYFSERQKHATREAGMLAGLKVKKVIDEPTAAAIAYGIDQKDDQDRMVLVFDLGGGTFDVSILLMIGGVFTQMDNEGDMWLGGDDFDRAIMDQVIAEVEKEYDLKNVAENQKFLVELRKKAREAKEALSSQDSADIIITDTLKDEDGLPLPIEYEITRSEFDQLIAAHVRRALECVEKALQEANFTKEEIDAVLLVGGSSTIPKFQQAIEDFFGKEKTLRGLDPMTCVAMGAGVLAKSLSFIWCPECQHENSMEADKCAKCGQALAAAKEEPREVENQSRTAKPYGIEIDGDRFEEIIGKNELFPTEGEFTKEFKTAMADQRIIKIPVREGFSDKASENELMGNIWFYDLPAGLPAETVIDVSMDLDADMVFTIGCRIRGMDWSRRMTLNHGGWENNILDKAMDAHVEMMGEGVSGQEAEEVEKQVRGIERAVEKGDQEAARSHLQELERIKEARQVEGIDSGLGDDWRRPLENVRALGMSNLDRVRSVLNTGDVNIRNFENWAQRAQGVLDRNDQAAAEGLVEEGWNLILKMPLAGELALADVLPNMPNVNPSTGARLGQAKQDFLACVDRNDGANLERTLGAFRQVLEEAMKQVGQEGPSAAPLDVLLKR